MIARCPWVFWCAETVSRPGMDETGADAYLFPLRAPSVPCLVALELADLVIHDPGELKCMDKDLRGRLWSSPDSIDGMADSSTSSVSSSSSSNGRLSSS